MDFIIYTESDAMSEQPEMVEAGDDPIAHDTDNPDFDDAYEGAVGTVAEEPVESVYGSEDRP